MNPLHFHLTMFNWNFWIENRIYGFDLHSFRVCPCVVKMKQRCYETNAKKRNIYHYHLFFYDLYNAQHILYNTKCNLVVVVGFASFYTTYVFNWKIIYSIWHLVSLKNECHSIRSLDYSSRILWPAFSAERNGFHLNFSLWFLVLFWVFRFTIFSVSRVRRAHACIHLICRAGKLFMYYF